MGNTSSNPGSGTAAARAGSGSSSIQTSPGRTTARSGSSTPAQGSQQPTLLAGSTSQSSGLARRSGAVREQSGSAAAAVPEESAVDTDPAHKALAASLYRQDSNVDGGGLVPLTGIYPSSPQDWLHDVVQRLIVDRKLAPFYRGLEDWDEDDFDRDEIDKALDKVGDSESKEMRAKYDPKRRQEEAGMYKKTSECPICFLYYPPLINTSRCCDQPICTECFVQIKRAEPTISNLNSEPAACPYCVEPNFGVTYIPPPLTRRSGLGVPRNAVFSTSPATTSPRPGGSAIERTSSASSDEADVPAPTISAAAKRRKSVSHTSSEVVTVDFIQQDWRAKLATVQQTAARRAARRVVFRQVGDRLIPVGISSGRDLSTAHAVIDNQGRLIIQGIPPGSTISSIEGGGGASSSGGSASPSRLLGRRGRNRGGTASSNADEGGRGQQHGIDLEEMMVMEAMRLSMIDEEERRKKEEKEKAKKEKKEKRKSKDSTPTLGGSNEGASTSTSGGGGLSLPRVLGGSGRNSPRQSLDTARPTATSSTRQSTEMARTAMENASRPVQPSPSSSSSSQPASAAPVQNNNPYAAYGAASSSSSSANTSRTSASTPSSNGQKQQPPHLERQDTASSMGAYDLPPPLVPDRAGGSSGGAGTGGASNRQQSDGSLI